MECAKHSRHQLWPTRSYKKLTGFAYLFVLLVCSCFVLASSIAPFVSATSVSTPGSSSFGLTFNTACSSKFTPFHGLAASESSSSIKCGGSRRGCISMATNDGKKKRKKQSADKTPQPSSSEISAPRVSNDINIPIRQQIRYAKLNKQYRQSSGQSFRQKKKVVRTKYRRTWDEEEIEQKAEERRRKGQDPDWDIILNRTATPPLVIVDGYNIIYKWARLKKHMAKGDTARARQLLLDDLENLGSIKGWRIEAVFDGSLKNNRIGPLGEKRQSTSAADKATSKDVSKHGVRVVFTGSGVEADTYIEARCAEAKNVTQGTITGSLIVATDDAMIRLAGVNAGAHCMSADRFVTELKAVKKAVAYRVEAAMAKVNGGEIRPEKLWGTDVFVNNRRSVGSQTNKTKSTLQAHADLATLNSNNLHETEDGKTVYTGRFGTGSVIIEDKRKGKRKRNRPSK